jgi:polyisoprenoid-binding protein YceI
MKNSSTPRKALMALLVVFLGLGLNAQTFNARLNQSSIKVSGTSNLHNWTMVGNGFGSEAQFTMQSAQLAAINELIMTIPVKNIKSNEGLLNSRAYKAMNADKYQNVIFQMTSSSITPQGNNQFLIKANGRLTISGVTRDVALTANGALAADKSMTISGSKKVKMTEFGIKPPSFMLGALKTGDEVTIEYTLKFAGN